MGLQCAEHQFAFLAVVPEARRRGAKVVVIDPFKTLITKQVDWHIPIRPGTDCALALGMMNVIIAEGLTDDDYIENHTLGFSQLKERAQGFPPEKVADITGIPEEGIRELAREFATSHASLIRIGVTIERHAGGGQTVRAIACLPGLTGTWRHPGGGMLQLPIWAFPVNWGNLMRPDLLPESEPRVLNLWKLGQALTGELLLDPPIKSLMVYNANLVITTPEQDKVLRGLEHEDLFTVISEQFLTDTARYADIVLPATMQVEQDDIMFSWGHLYLSYNHKAIEPLGEAVSNSELFRRLARIMGFDDDPFFRRDDAQMIREGLVWDSPLLEGITLEDVMDKGYVRLNVPAPDEYAPHAEGKFHTPSGRCEFKAAAAEGGNFVIALFRQGYDGQQLGDPVDPVPNYIPPNESAATRPDLANDFPLSLVSPKSHAFLSSTFANMERQLEHAGQQSLVMHSRDAEHRSLRSGQKVRVFNGRGAFEAMVTVTDDVVPGVVMAPVGYWRSKDLVDRSTLHSVTSSAFADLGAAPTFSDVLVQVEPATAAWDTGPSHASHRHRQLPQVPVHRMRQRLPCRVLSCRRRNGLYRSRRLHRLRRLHSGLSRQRDLRHAEHAAGSRALGRNQRRARPPTACHLRQTGPAWRAPRGGVTSLASVRDMKPLHIAIVESGPSGFYAAEALLRAGKNVAVDMYEKLPVPFGLVRYGVAPDHPKLKQITDIFARIAEMPGFRYFGNVHIGRDIPVERLGRHYHGVIFASGAEREKDLGIPGESLAGSHSARAMSRWT